MPDQVKDSSPWSLTSDGGLIKFLGGLVVGLALKSLGSYFLDAEPPAKSSSKKGSRKSTSKHAASMCAAAAARQYPREEMKMVLCVNTSLGMGKGKIGAQCAHAAVGVVEMYKGAHEAAFRSWARTGQAKIALKVKDDTEMAVLAEKAFQLGLPAYIVQDAGRTQIAAGSQTVLAIGPGPKSQIDQVTGHLSLL